MASAQAPIEDLQCRKMAKKVAQLDKPSGLAAKEKKIGKQWISRSLHYREVSESLFSFCLFSLKTATK